MNQYELAREVAVRVEDYHLSCIRLADLFCEKYEFYKVGESEDSFWVANEPGGVLCVGNYSFSLDDILDALCCNVDGHSLIEWTDYCETESLAERTPMNLRSWYKLKKRKQQ